MWQIHFDLIWFYNCIFLWTIFNKNVFALQTVLVWKRSYLAGSYVTSLLLVLEDVLSTKLCLSTCSHPLHLTLFGLVCVSVCVWCVHVSVCISSSCCWWVRYGWEEERTTVPLGDRVLQQALWTAESWKDKAPCWLVTFNNAQPFILTHHPRQPEYPVGKNVLTQNQTPAHQPKQNFMWNCPTVDIKGILKCLAKHHSNVGHAGKHQSIAFIWSTNWTVRESKGNWQREEMEEKFHWKRRGKPGISVQGVRYLQGLLLLQLV